MQYFVAHGWNGPVIDELQRCAGIWDGQRTATDFMLWIGGVVTSEMVVPDDPTRLEPEELQIYI